MNCKKNKSHEKLNAKLSNSRHLFSKLHLSPGDHLKQLKPSAELLDYYREKILQATKENEELQDKVEECKNVCDLSFQLEQELHRRNSEVSSLQQAVSDLQIYLYQEREQVLKLYAENDKLKIRELENHKKIDLLLSISGTSARDLTCFLRDDDSGITVKQRLPPRLQRHRSKVKIDGDPSLSKIQDPNLLRLEVQSLTAQLEEQSQLSRDHVESILKDRELSHKERQAERNRLESNLTLTTSRLKETQDKLCETTKELIKLQEDHRHEEMRWVNERNLMSRNLQVCRDQVGELFPNASGYAVSGNGSKGKRGTTECNHLTEELNQRDSLVSLYQEQCVAFEAEMNKLREQTISSKRLFQDRTKKMASQVSYLKSKYNQLDRRRILEAQGFRNDVKMLRESLRSLERNIKKAVNMATIPVTIPIVPSQSDKESGRLEVEIRNIKRKVLDIEEDLRDTSCMFD